MNNIICLICKGNESDYSLMEYCTENHIYHKACLSNAISNRDFRPVCLSCFIYAISYIKKCDYCLFCGNNLSNCPMKINMCRACEETFTNRISVPKCTYCENVHMMSVKRCANCRTYNGQLDEISKGNFICKACAESASDYNQGVNTVVLSDQYEESLKRGKSGKCVLCRKYDDDSFILCPKGYHYCMTCKNCGDFTYVKDDCSCSSCEEILSLLDIKNIPKILGQPSKEYEEPCSVCKIYNVYNYISQCQYNKLYCPSCLGSRKQQISEICPCAYCQSLSRGVYPKFFIPCTICSKSSLFNYKSLCSHFYYYCVDCLGTRPEDISSKCECDNCSLLSKSFFIKKKCSICKQYGEIIEGFICQNKNYYCESCCGKSYQKIRTICQCNACTDMHNFLYTNYMGKKCEICNEKFLPVERSCCPNEFYYCQYCCKTRAYEIFEICNCPWCKMMLESGLSQNSQLYSNINCKICLSNFYYNTSELCERKHFYCSNCLKAHNINVNLIKCISNYCTKIKEKWSKISYNQEKITSGGSIEMCFICKKTGIFECKKKHKLCEKCIFEGNLKKLNEICDKISQKRYKEIDMKFWYRCGFDGCNDCILVPGDLVLAKYDGYLSAENAQMLGRLVPYIDGVKVSCFACELNRAAGDAQRIQLGCKCRC